MARNKSSATAERNRPSNQGGRKGRTAQESPLETARAHAVGVLNSHGIRELVESIVIAFVLAFLFKTFEAEAFVIPTGSMAETLQGRHKDFVCPKCDYQYRASASDEVDPNTNVKLGEVYSASCPMCGYRSVLNLIGAAEAVRVDPHSFNRKQYQGRTFEELIYVDEDRVDAKSYSGDRILVNKFAYELGDPKRWDVIVFRFPEDANKNYIKRLIGLPGETLEMHRGDIFTKPNEGAGGIDPGIGEFQIARKPPRKIHPMSHIVYNNNYVADELVAHGWPLRWQPWRTESDSPGWTSEDTGRRFRTTDDQQGTEWIRYQHFPSSMPEWDEVILGAEDFRFEQIRPELITDSYTYNSSSAIYPGKGLAPLLPNWKGLHWVGDLVLDAAVDVESAQGKLLLDLVKGGLHFTCEINLADGVAVLSITDPVSGKTYPFTNAAGEDIALPTADTDLESPGEYEVSMANVDDQIVVWVNGDVVEFGGFENGQVTYNNLPTNVPRSTPEHAGDLAPAGIGAEGGAELAVRDIKLSRDVYYIAGPGGMKLRNGLELGMSDYMSHVHFETPLAEATENRVQDFYTTRSIFFATPQLWPDVFSEMQRDRFVLEEFPETPEKDQFFAAGDNSPASFDSRMWRKGNFFERDLLIGKAVFIYWPHSLDKPIPFFPNFKRMRFVH